MSWVYLSHPLSESTPLYGGDGRVSIDRLRSMAAGQTSNNSGLAFPAHAGTHIDAPSHFDPTGRSLDTYPAEFWHVARPWLIDCPADAGEVIGLARLEKALAGIPQDCDLLLLRTGFERFRSSEPERYCRHGPGLDPKVCTWLRHDRNVKMLGVDFVSISSHEHRELGRKAHQALLSADVGTAGPVLPVEDMALAVLEGVPREAWIMPILFTAADGAPVTVVASI